MDTTTTTKHIYTGRIRLHEESYDGPDDVLFVLPADYDGWYDDDETLASQIEEHIKAHGPYLSVQYFVSDVALNADDLQVAWLDRLEGIGDADYTVHWSDYTGYLWTDEEIKVGGHNLLEELKSHKNQYLYLEIEYRKEKP